MEIDKYLSEFTRSGYTILPIEDISLVEKSKNFLANHIRKKFSQKGSDNEILNNCHNYIVDISDSKVNSLIIEIINKFSLYYNMDEIVYHSAKKFLDKVLGPDIASQKNPNIVFQSPYSTRISELHTDAPANSYYEIVSWLPLVDCYESKSFYILDKQSTINLQNEHKNNQYTSWSELREQAIKNAKHLEIQYGNVLLFWSGLLHGSIMNKTMESRWSYNVRYKNLFAPAGLKEPLSFYKVFTKSPITDLATNII